MEQTSSKVRDLTPFYTALHLHPTTEAVVEHNVSKLHSSGKPVATIKAVHTGANASKASPDDAGGLHPILCMAQGARVMLTSNLWVEVGLINGAMGTVAAICYSSGHHICHGPLRFLLWPNLHRWHSSHHSSPLLVVHIWSSVFTVAAPSEAGLGSQSSGPYLNWTRWSLMWEKRNSHLY